MKIFKQVLYVIMAVIGLLIVGGAIFGFIIIENINRDDKSFLPMLNVKLLNSSKLEEENNNKYIILNGTITSTATDPVFNVTVNGVGVRRVVREWNGNYWEYVNESSNKLYRSEIFNANEFVIGDGCVLLDYNRNNVNFNSLKPVLDNSTFFELDTKNIKLPKGFSIKNDADALLHYDLTDDFLNYYSTSTTSPSYSYITNSTTEQPKVGDIRIYFQPLFPNGSKYISVLGKQVDKKIVLDRQSIYELSNNYISLQYFSYFFYIVLLIYKILYIILCILPFIGFMLLFFGITKLDIFEQKFGKIKKYKVFLTSLILGIIVPVVFYLLLL